MTKWLLIDFSVLACVMALSGFIIPQILLIAFRKNLFDAPDPRKIHKTEVPRLGGIAFFPSILFSMFLLYGLGMLSNDLALMARLTHNMVPYCFIVCSSILLFLTGMADDLVGVKYKAKFIMQTVAAILIIIGGMQINNLHGLFGIENMPVILSYVLTVLMIVFVINAINLIDGIDGLASGLSSIACMFYAYVFYKANLFVFSAIAMATLGALIPFFMYNVFGNPQKHKKIFMGDTGAYTIGLLLSAMSIRICHTEALSGSYNPIVIAFAPLIIPCLDVVRVYLHRIKAKRNPFLPDKTHIHHKLLALGMKQRKAMAIIISSSILITIANYLLSMYMEVNILLLCNILLWVSLNTIITRAIHIREKALSQTLYE